MTEQAEARPAGADLAKAIVAGALVLAGVVAFYAFPAQSAAVRWLMFVGGLVLGAVAFATSAYARALAGFVVGARVELRKMVWPTVPETRQTTLLVFAFVVVMALFFWLVDLGLGFATRKLLGQG
jgi:preprotein translocase subunit SecE